MLATVCAVCGVVIGVVLLTLARMSGKPARSPYKWSVLTAGAVGTSLLTLGAFVVVPFMDPVLLSITLAVAAVTAGTAMLAYGNHGWQLWVGTFLGAIPTALWITLVVGGSLV